MDQPIKFQGGPDKILELLHSSQDIIEYLIGQSAECPMIDNEIKLTKLLGQGAQGAVYEIDFPDRGRNKYAVKKLADLDTDYIFWKKESKTIREIYDLIPSLHIYPKEIFFKINNGPDTIIATGQEIVVPTYAISCFRKKNLFTRFDTDSPISYPGKSYICESSDYTEYIIAAICGELYRQNKSIHFIDTFGFTACFDNETPINYIFMQQIDGVLLETIQHVGEEYQNIFIIQILHSIAVYQKKYKISHNDLHLGNVFLSGVDQNTVFKGRHVDKYKQFCYKIGDKKIYVPNTGVLPKIGDFGYAIMWRKPIMGSQQIFLDGMSQGPFDQPWMPNWWCPQYDALFVITALYTQIPDNMMVKKLMALILDCDIADIATEKPKLYRSSNSRPRMTELSKYSEFTADRILQNSDIFGKYYTSKSDKSLLLGSV
jgi:hypothetical protein